MTGIRGQSAPGQRRGARPQTDKSRIVVPFEDNRLLSNLLGEYDSNLALLEDRLGIEAHAHGNVIILTGSATNCQIAREVWEELYKRAGRGEPIGPGPVRLPARPVGAGRLGAANVQAAERHGPGPAALRPAVGLRGRPTGRPSAARHRPTWLPRSLPGEARPGSAAGHAAQGRDPVRFSALTLAGRSPQACAQRGWIYGREIPHFPSAAYSSEMGFDDVNAKPV